MTTREAAIAKLKQLPDSLLQQVNDFMDFLIHQRYQTITNGRKDELVEAWEKWFDAVDQLDVLPDESVSDYQKHLVSKYRKQGLEL